jgi:hypothetical protein
MLITEVVDRSTTYIALCNALAWRTNARVRRASAASRPRKVAFNRSVLMHRLTLRSRLLLPVGDSALIQAEDFDNGLGRAAVSQQGDDLEEPFHRLMQAIEGRPLPLDKGTLTDRAEVATFLLGMNPNVALADTPSGGTGFVRAKYSLRVHAHHPFLCGFSRRIMAWTLCFFKKMLLHDSMWSYPPFEQFWKPANFGRNSGRSNPL